MPPDGNATPETILVIENDAGIRTALSTYLRDCGYAVIEAASVAEALVRLRGDGHEITIIFSGVDLSGSDDDGRELAAWLRRRADRTDLILAKSLPRLATAAAELCNNGPSDRTYHPGEVVDRIHQLKAERAAQRRDADRGRTRR